jgi:hypothetical protein
MTVKERVEQLLGFQPGKGVVEGALIDYDLTGSDNYEKSLSTSVRRCALSILEVLLSTADTVDGNQISIKYDRAAIQKRIDRLQAELDGESSSRTIKGISPW